MRLPESATTGPTVDRHVFVIIFLTVAALVGITIQETLAPGSNFPNIPTKARIYLRKVKRKKEFTFSFSQSPTEVTLSMLHHRDPIVCYVSVGPTDLGALVCFLLYVHICQPQVMRNTQAHM